MNRCGGSVESLLRYCRACWQIGKEWVPNRPCRKRPRESGWFSLASPNSLSFMFEFSVPCSEAVAVARPIGEGGYWGLLFSLFSYIVNFKVYILS